MADQNETYRAKVRGWLESVPVPQSGLDASHILRVGRARARRRRYAAAGGVAVAAIMVAAALPAVVQVLLSGAETSLGPAAGQHGLSSDALTCDVLALQVLDHAERGEPRLSEVRVDAMDSTGRYVLGTWPAGETSATGGSSAIILWDDGDPTYLPTLRGYPTGQDVNEQGVVVGDGWDQNEYAWIYSDETARELLVPRGYKSARALGVNADGDVVGTASDTDGQVVVVRWPATDLDRPSTLTGLAGMILTPAGITDDGRIVATIGQDGRDRGVYMWEADGIGRTLPMPPGAIGGYVTTVHGDWAAGAAYIPPASGEAVQPTPHTDGRGDVVVDVPVRWNLTTSTVDFLLDSTDGDVGRASAVTADGNVLLEAEESIFIRDDQRYVLSTSGGQARPTAVSGDGSVFVGVVVTTRPGSAEVVRQPTLWRC